MRHLHDLVRLMRPYQWIKNGFVLVGLVFGHGWNDPLLVAHGLQMFVAFCLTSSGVYILNDVLDRHADRAHPRKQHRPVASGAVGVCEAVWWVAALCAAGVALAWGVSPTGAMIIAAYVILNIAYSKGLKHVAVLDVFIIAAGFMLRILAGTSGVGITPSPWLLGCGMMLTLFLGFSKRRAELLSLEENAHEGGNGAVQRPSLDGYSPALLDRLIAISAAGAALGYAFYSLDARTIEIHGTDKLILTLPFVLYGLFRFLYALYRREAGADPAGDLLRDRHLIAAIAGWLAATWWLIA